MLNRLYSGVVVGVDGVLIEVEVDVSSRGLPNFTIVGLPNKSVEEARERVKAAIKNSSFEFPSSKITVNLAPADIPKRGCGFDLPIAVGIMAGCGIINPGSFLSSIFLGELSLTGKIKAVNGSLPIIESAFVQGIKNAFLPTESLFEASLIKNISLFGVKDLVELVLHLNNQKAIEPYVGRVVVESDRDNQFDFAFIKGQNQAKRSFEIAAAGFHNLRLTGQPGSGKTILARCLPSILPPLTREEKIETNRIYSAAGLISDQIRSSSRPFRSPHHTISRIGLIGGGGSVKPGEISLAHRGVLFMDEISEYPRSVIESLRQPLEDGFVWISRASGKLKFPSRFMLIVVSNPCPCGFLGHPKKTCFCSQGAIVRYRKKMSGPFLDRIDLHVNVGPVESGSLIGEQESEKSKLIRERVIKARMIQQKRLNGLLINTNGEMGTREIKKFCLLENSAKDLLQKAVDHMSLSARSYFKTIKVARTIADLATKDNICVNHIAEALQFREQDQ